MMNRKRVFWATTALFTGVLAAGSAFAQSSGTTAAEATEVETVVVTGARGPRNIDGLAVAENVGKTRNTVTQEFIATQTPGQTILQTLNLTPGLSFTNADPYGSSGGNIRLRGFDGNRVSLTFDGIPLNDTGNYATYTNQQMDPELIERASVNTGTTDVDSPTASATGGTVNYMTRRPASEFGGWGQASFGSFDYQRFMILLDSGEFGPWGTSAWFAYSGTEYDKFKGLGEIRKEQWNARVYQPIRGNGDFLALSAHYNENRNNNYNGPNLRTATGFCDVAQTVVCNDQVVDDPRGWEVDFDTTYTAPTFRNGVADNDTNGTGFYGLRVNPSNTGNIRGNSRFTLSEGLVLTIDPSFQYTLANGGTQQAVLFEQDALLRGSFGAGGVDLNGDGDILDRIKLYSPSNTNTRRYSVNASLIWDINDDHRVRFAYTWDRGDHRQTSEFGYLDSAGNFDSWFGGKEGHGRQILTRDGDVFQERNRASIALLNQFAVEYNGSFLNDTVRLNLGLRAPFFRRELNNFCWQTDTFNAWCTRQRPTTPLVSASVSALAGAPVSFEREYEDILPNVGASWEFATDHTVFASYSANLSAPRTDDLYDRVPADPEPETSTNWELGYRYGGRDLIVSTSVFYSQFENYIVRAFETLPDSSTIAYSINAGSIDRWGIDASLGYQLTDAFSIFASASYISSEIQSDIPNETGGFFDTAGNELAEVPELQWALRGEYETGPFTFGAQAKYVGERWTNLVNDEATPSYTVVDLDGRMDLDFINEGMFLQVNVQNLFDEDYLANISTAASGNRSASIGAPRSVSATLRIVF